MPTPAHSRPAADDRLSGLLRNDPASLRALYTAHFGTVRSFVLANSGTGDDARDVFQEAITVLWLRAREGTLAPGTDPGAFLFSIARNKWLDTVRSAAHRHMNVVHDQRMHAAAVEPDDGVEERLARLRAIYERLDDKGPAALGRVYNVGHVRSHSLDEIARALTKLADTGSQVISTPWPPIHRRIDIGSFETDSSAIRTELGWVATTDLEDGLCRTLDFYREHPWSLSSTWAATRPSSPPPIFGACPT